MMTRIQILVTIALSCTGIGAWAAQVDRPNFLLIISDDQAWTDYGFMGHPHIDTPTLDQLAADSLTFTRGYVSSPLCRPSLASILTGMPTHIHGTTGNDPATGGTRSEDARSRSLPQFAALHETLYTRLRSLPIVVRLLQQAGYATMQTGKWWESDPKTFGFTNAMTHGDPARGARHGDEGLKISREGIEPIRKFLDGCQQTTEAAAKPFFIWHAPFMPHSPHTAPEPLVERYRKVAPSEPVAQYWAMCEWFDQTCGELLEELDARGLTDNTVVIYVADNGWIQDAQQANKFAARSKTTPYEGGIRTPIMVKWPGKIAPMLDAGTLVSSIDIAPTLLSAAELPVPKSMPGMDLRDIAALRKRNAVYGSVHPHTIIDVHRPNVGTESRFIIAGNWKLIAHEVPREKLELFHLQVDPYETTNLANRHPAVVRALLEKLNKWWQPGDAARHESKTHS